MTPFEELCKTFKIAPTDDETYDHFARRAVKKVNGCSDPQWNELSEGIQRWTNGVQRQIEQLEDPESEIDLLPVKMGDARDAEEIEFGWPEEANGGDDGEEGEEEGNEESENGDETEEGEGEADDGQSEGEDDGAEEGGQEGEEDGGSENANDAEEGVDAEANSGQEEAPRSAGAKRAKPGKKKGTVAKASAGAQKPKTGKAKKMASKPATKRAAANARSRISDNDTIKVVAKTNPYRENSIGHKVFTTYKDGMKVKAFADKIAKLETERSPSALLRFDIKKGHVKVIPSAAA